MDLVDWLGIPTDQWHTVDVRYDRNGFRNDAEITKADIALVGDSFVEAAIVPHADVTSSRLARAATGHTKSGSPSAVTGWPFWRFVWAEVDTARKRPEGLSRKRQRPDWPLGAGK